MPDNHSGTTTLMPSASYDHLRRKMRRQIVYVASELVCNKMTNTLLVCPVTVATGAGLYEPSYDLRGTLPVLRRPPALVPRAIAEQEHHTRAAEPSGWSRELPPDPSPPPLDTSALRLVREIWSNPSKLRQRRLLL